MAEAAVIGPRFCRHYLAVIVYAILGVNDRGIDGTPISAKSGGALRRSGLMRSGAVELASMLLLAGLVVAFHVVVKSVRAKC